MAATPPAHPPSRLLRRLEQAIAAAASDPSPACAGLKVQRAVLLARHGQVGKAREQLTALHQQAFQHPHPLVDAWLHYGEALMNYFSDFGRALSVDKLKRALALAAAEGHLELQALAGAWLSHLAYVRHDIEQLIHHARETLALAAPGQHGAYCRLGIALCLANEFAGQAEHSLAWWMLARGHAQAEGDDASLSALIYNQAELRCARQRRASLRSQQEQGGRELILGVDSVAHYDAAVGGAALPELTPLLRAQALVVHGEYGAAREIYEAYLPQAIAQGLTRLGSTLLAELAWCRVNLGQPEQALRQAQIAEFELDPACDVDDRATTHSRLAQVYAALDDQATAQRHAASAAAEWAEFERQQAEWARALEQAGLSRPG